MSDPLRRSMMREATFVFGRMRFTRWRWTPLRVQLATNRLRRRH
jgi:hypothetical protein